MVLPQTVSHYEVEATVGHGGMGEVCRAVDLRLGRVVAIKFQSRELLESAEWRERFLNEGRTLSSLSHPNIATIYEADDAGGRPFMVMEYLPGGTLKERVRGIGAAGGTTSFGQIARWCLSLAKALDYAHRHDVLHRDIKTSNAMFDEEDRLKLTDFGLARSAESEATHSGTISGTFSYMAPELLLGVPPSEKSDLYSLGMTFYEVAAGTLPFADSSQASLIHKILHETPPPLESKRPDLPARFLELVERLISKNPHDRPDSAREVAAVLSQLSQPSAAPGENDLTITLPEAMPRSQSWRVLPRRRSWAIAALVAALVGAAWLLPQLRERLSNVLQRADLPQKRYIAVLPFNNIGGDEAQQALCDGLMETLTTALSRRTRMQVVPPSEVREIRSAEQARREFGVNLVLAGSLQRRDSGVRLTLRLVDAETRRQLDAREIDSGPGGEAQAEESILLQVAEMLDTAFEAPSVSPVYASAASFPGAWDMYLKGKGFVYRSDKEGNLERAVQAFDEAIRREPRLAQAWAGLAEARLLMYRQLKDPASLEAARTAAGRALQLESGLAEARILLGAALADARLYDLAEKELETARITAPSEPLVYRELARLCGSRGQEERAETVYRQAIAARPEDWKTYNYLGVFYTRQERYAEAEAQFRKVVELTPDNHMGYRNLGGTYLQMGRYRESEQASKRAASLRPSATAWSNLGALYLLEHRYPDAVHALEEAWRLMPREAPRNYRIPGNLGEAYRFSRAPAGKAASAYQQAIQIAEKQLTGTAADASLHSSLALYYAGSGDPAQAVKQVEQAIKDKPDDAEIRYRAAAVFAQTGNVPRALAELKEALEFGYPPAPIKDAPLLEPLRSDPGYRKLLAQYPASKR